MATRKPKSTPAADPKELAEKFAQKKSGEARRREKLEKLKQQDRNKAKVSLEEVVIPFLRKVQEQFHETTHLPEDFLFGVSQLDHNDHRPLGVYFTLAGATTVVISIAANGIVAERMHKTGARDSAYPKEAKPVLKTHADLTEVNIGKLISMMIDEMPDESKQKPVREALPSTQGEGA
jgi:hypothetical protein